MMLPPALAALGGFRQFINYVVSQRPDGSYDKVPSDYRTGETHINAHDAQFHTDFATARAASANVAFVLTESDPFFCLDIDHCLIDGQWNETALSLLREFPGAACEVSLSGTGLHLWGAYSKIPAHGTRSSTVAGIELYHRLRFIALGRADAAGDIRTDCTGHLHRVIPSYFPVRVNAVGAPVDWTREPVPEWRGPTDDKDLIRRALRSASAAAAFGGKAQFIDLWERNVAVLAEVFPAAGAKDFNESSADAALAAHLRFWTGADCARIQRLMEQSGLVREKYARPDYLPRTILAVVSGGGAVCKDRSHVPASDPEPEKRVVVESVIAVTPREEPMFADGKIQAELFKACVYITEENEILMPNGEMWDQAQFDNRMSKYIFLLDNENTKTTDKAWTCFMKSKILTFAKVDRGFFRPDLPIGRIVREESGVSFVNTYIPCGVRPMEGDPTPFIDLLTRMFPLTADRNIILAYLAFLVQFPGVKSQWALVLQGVEGNGKSTINECMEPIIGPRYYYAPGAAELTGKFNGFCDQKMLIAVNDMYQFSGGVDVLERLKPMITGTTMEIEKKGKDKCTVRSCANFIFNTNHKDGIRKTRNDRRFAIVYAAQQQKEDLLRDGLTFEYFKRLRHWLHDGGFAIVSNYLRKYLIPDEINPANGGHAPLTSSTEEALGLGLDPLEQEVQECVDQSRLGFCGGWISSFAIDQLLEALRKTIPRNKRRAFLLGLGYIRHPGLTNGRTHSPITDCGITGCPTLYVKPGHLSLNVHNGAEIARLYQEAQHVAHANGRRFA